VIYFRDILGQIQYDIPWPNTTLPKLPKGQATAAAACDQLLAAAPNGGLEEEQMEWVSFGAAENGGCSLTNVLCSDSCIKLWMTYRMLSETSMFGQLVT
jgi:hypothetical protein